MDEIAWHPQPPRPSGYQQWRYEPLKIGRSVTGCIITKLVGVYTHWAGATVPCLGATCKHCDSGKEARWVGYIGLICGGGARRVFVVPATSALRYTELLVPGALVDFTRHSARAPLSVQLVRHVTGAGPVEDLTPVLQWMWRRHLPQATSDKASYVPEPASQHGRTATAGASTQPPTAPPRWPDQLRGNPAPLVPDPLVDPLWVQFG